MAIQSLKKSGINNFAKYRSALAGNIPFLPTNLTNLAAWYDASNTSSISVSGSDVTQWNDLSGNNRHATQGTSTNRPKSGTRTMNGKNVIDFDGVNDLLINDSLSTPFIGEDVPFTFFAVLRSDSSSGGSPFALTSTSIGGPYLWPYADVFLIRDNGGGDGTTFTITGSNALSDLSVTYRSSGLNFTGWVNQTLVRTQSYNAGFLSLNAGTIGGFRYAFTSGDFFFDGAIAELIFYSRELSLQEVASVQDYLKTKWSL
jgi:hypothetical protein